MKGFVTKLCDIDSIEIPKEMLEIRVDEQQLEEKLSALSLRYAKEEPTETAQAGDTVFCQADRESYPDGRTILLYTSVPLPGAEDAETQADQMIEMMQLTGELVPDREEMLEMMRQGAYLDGVFQYIGEMIEKKMGGSHGND